MKIVPPCTADKHRVRPQLHAGCPAATRQLAAMVWDAVIAGKKTLAASFAYDDHWEWYFEHV